MHACSIAKEREREREKERERGKEERGGVGASRERYK